MIACGLSQQKYSRKKRAKKFATSDERPCTVPFSCGVGSQACQATIKRSLVKDLKLKVSAAIKALSLEHLFLVPSSFRCSTYNHLYNFLAPS